MVNFVYPTNNEKHLKFQIFKLFKERHQNNVNLVLLLTLCFSTWNALSPIIILGSIIQALDRADNEKPSLR